MPSRGKVAFAACASGVVLYYAGKRFLLSNNGRPHEISDSLARQKRRKDIPALNMTFLKQLLKLVRISIPSVISKEFFLLLIHTAALVSRTFLSIYVAQLDGRLVKAIVEGNVPKFFKLIVNWILLAVPATFVNSLIRYVECKLALAIRSRLVEHAYGLYFDDQTYYRVSNLDGRLTNPDHSLTEDLQAFSSAVTHIYSHVSKPILDIVLMSGEMRRLAQRRGETSPVPGYIGLSTIIATAAILKAVSPPFGKLVAEEARRNGYLRYLHSRIITNAEEIAFYAGHTVSCLVTNYSFIQTIDGGEKRRELGRERERESNCIRYE